MSDVQGKLCALLIACKSRIRETYVVKDEAERQLTRLHCLLRTVLGQHIAEDAAVAESHAQDDC